MRGAPGHRSRLAIVIPNWRAHQLSGRRKEVWSLTVTGNWRITFRIDPNIDSIIDLNYEDYH